MDDKKRYGTIKAVLILILALNWLVAFAKIFYGLFTKCSSMTADGFHSLSDGASNIIGLIGIYLASFPKDEDHPYGHKKYETLFSLAIAAMLFVVCFNLLKEGIVKLFKPVVPEITIQSFVIMIVTMAINIFVMKYELKKGKSLKSDILVSDSMHTKADIFTSLSVIVTLCAVKLGFPLLDPIATILISLFIAHAGYDIIRDSSKILCDTAAITDVKKIVDIVLGVKGVKTCHKIRTRGRPDDVHIDLHVQVNPDMHVDNAHEVSYTIEESIKKYMPEVTDVIVHIEPRGDREEG